MYYKAISTGINNRKLVPENQVISSLSDLYQQDPDKDYYVSVFRYNQKHYDQFQKSKSLAGIKDIKTQTLLFDFDDKKNPENARQDALTLVSRLQTQGISSNDINIYFSGNKGNHIEVNFNEELSRDEANNIRNSLAGDLETNDTSVKDEQRLLRAVLSKNDKSGLFKIPLTMSELQNLSVEQIREQAKEVTDAHVELAEKQLVSRTDMPEQLGKLRFKKEVLKKEVKRDEDRPNFNKNKTGLTNAKYALSEGYFEEGERHEAIMILAATFLGLGWHKELTYNTLKATLRLRAIRLDILDLNDEDKRELWREVEQVYSVTWKGGMYSEDTNELLIKTKERYNVEDKFENNAFLSLPEVDSVFGDFAKNIDKNTIKLGIPSFDKAVRVTTSTLVMLLAPPATGKTSITFGILNATSNDNIKSMFFSLDMAAPQVYQRLAQRHTGLQSDMIFDAYKNNDKQVIENIRTTLEEQYKNVKFCFKGAMSVDIIRQNILKQKEIQGEFPKLVVIDYLENITTDFTDASASKAYAGRCLKDMANEFGICIFLLVQPRLSSGDGANELNSFTNIKGSSVLGEVASQVFTMYRPGFNPKDSSNDDFLSITVVKNRMGNLGRFDYHWTGLTGSIREMTHEESAELKCLLEQKAAEKKGMSDL